MHNELTRRLLRSMSASGLIALCLIACACVEAAEPDHRLGGTWRIEKPVFAVRTIEGNEPPSTPDAARIYREHLAARERGDSSFDSATWCASVGMPRILFIDYPFKLVIRPPYVAFLHEWNRWARVVYLHGGLADPASADAEVRSAELPTFGPPVPRSDLPGPMGLSLGRWEGETLVIETSGLVDSTLIDSAGVPHSDQLKIVERLRLRSQDILENRIRIEDATVFTRPWETVVTYRRQRTPILEEDVCLDRIKTGAPAVMGSP